MRVECPNCQQAYDIDGTQMSEFECACGKRVKVEKQNAINNYNAAMSALEKPKICITEIEISFWNMIALILQFVAAVIVIIVPIVIVIIVLGILFGRLQIR